MENQKNNQKLWESDGNAAAREDMTLDEWFLVWLRDYKQLTVKKGTIENYRRNYRSYVQKYLGDRKVTEIKGEQIQKMFNYLILQGYAVSTLYVSKGLLSGMFKQLIKDDVLVKNPVQFVEFPRQSRKKERRVMSQEEQTIFMEYAKGSLYEDIYLLALATGMRIGEICALRWSDIDFSNQRLTVNGTLKQFKDTGFYIDTPKSVTSRRIVPLLPLVCKMLKRRKREQVGTVMRSDKGKTQWKDLVFLNPREGHGPVRKRTIAYDMDAIVKRINEDRREQCKKKRQCPEIFQRVSPHALRHTFATRALENGIPPKVVQEILGHSSITITLDLYTHVLDKTKNEEILKLQKIF